MRDDVVKPSKNMGEHSKYENYIISFFINSKERDKDFVLDNNYKTIIYKSVKDLLMSYYQNSFVASVFFFDDIYVVGVRVKKTIVKSLIDKLKTDLSSRTHSLDDCVVTFLVEKSSEFRTIT